MISIFFAPRASRHNFGGEDGPPAAFSRSAKSMTLVMTEVTVKSHQITPVNDQSITRTTLPVTIGSYNFSHNHPMTPALPVGIKQRIVQLQEGLILWEVESLESVPRYRSQNVRGPCRIWRYTDPSKRQAERP